MILIGDKVLSFEKCEGCRLFGGPECTQIVHGFGNVKADIMFIGEGPGYNEDQQGYPFVGKSGNTLRTNINSFLGISDQDAFYTNVVRCHPPGNRDPLPDELTACQRYWHQELAIVAPKMIVCVGNFAAKMIIGKSFNKISVDRRKRFSNDYCQVIIPVMHPAAIRGSEAEKISKEADFKLDIKAVRTIYDEIKQQPKLSVNIQPEKTFDLF